MDDVKDEIKEHYRIIDNVEIPIFQPKTFIKQYCNLCKNWVHPKYMKKHQQTAKCINISLKDKNNIIK